MNSWKIFIDYNDHRSGFKADIQLDSRIVGCPIAFLPTLCFWLKIGESSTLSGQRFNRRDCENQGTGAMPNINIRTFSNLHHSPSLSSKMTLPKKEHKKIDFSPLFLPNKEQSLTKERWMTLQLSKFKRKPHFRILVALLAFHRKLRIMKCRGRRRKKAKSKHKHRASS